jgi:hypothetical protein
MRERNEMIHLVLRWSVQQLRAQTEACHIDEVNAQYMAHRQCFFFGGVVDILIEDFEVR